jgi:hypothetical protein
MSQASRRPGTPVFLRCMLQVQVLRSVALFCIMRVHLQKGEPAMSNKKRQSTKRPPSGKGRQKPDAASLAIPIVVGLVVLAIIVVTIVTVEKRQSLAAVPTSTISVPVVTAQPLPTTTIPYPLVPRISLKDTQAKLDKGEAVLIDVRSKESYDQSHAAGALSIPETELDARLSELPRDRALILY